jgi:magnesium-transporting ATPase (P-type)
MILDNYLNFNNKVIISIICSGIWIYFRTSDCYNLIPRYHLFPVIFVMIWAYLNYYEPLFLPIGLLILILYSKIKMIDSIFK